MKNLTSWGGKRANAGRKKSDIKKIRKTFYGTEKQLNALESIWNEMQETEKHDINTIV